MDAALHVLEVVLVVVTFAWVGKRPTVAKVSTIVCVVWLVELGSAAVSASAAGMGLFDYSMREVTDSLQAVSGSMNSDQQAALSRGLAVAVGCLPGLYAVRSSMYVFVALCARWAFDKLRHRSTWTAFSELDLSYWWVIPLIAGVVCYIVSLMPGIPHQHEVLLVALNILVVSVIPLFVQGAACGKGIMNRFGLEMSWQLVLGFFGVATDAVFIVLPVLGLIDFWANFRRLPRDGEKPEQRRLPD